jgi:8-oxo-dGTP pyrophosphatase MutT (NUDIX family)
MSKESTRPALADSAAALIRHIDGRFLMQLRDDRADIPFPGHWGCFGGSLEPGESVEAALRRELFEELELVVRTARPIAILDFDARPLGLGRCFRAFFLVAIDADDAARLVLHEGATMRFLTLDEVMSHPKVTPYDRHAFWLYQLGQRHCGV